MQDTTSPTGFEHKSKMNIIYFLIYPFQQALKKLNLQGKKTDKTRVGEKNSIINKNNWVKTLAWHYDSILSEATIHKCIYKAKGGRHKLKTSSLDHT